MLEVEAAVSDSLPVSVLLGTDVPELGKLLQFNPNVVHSTEVERALVVTRARAREEAEEEEERHAKEQQSGATPNPVLETNQDGNQDGDQDGDQDSDGEMLADPDIPGSNFDDSIFANPTPVVRERQTRSQKRKERKNHGLERAKDQPKKSTNANPTIGLTTNELRKHQEEDKTLERARVLAEGKSEEVDGGYFMRDGLLYRKWVHHQGEEMPVEQIVLPKICRQAVLHLAHTIPMAGHLSWAKRRQPPGF